MNFLSKLIFLLRRPKVIVVTGKGREMTKEAVFKILKEHIPAGKRALVFETDPREPSEIKKFQFLLKNSPSAVLIVSHIGEIPPDKDFFAGQREKTKEIRKLAKILPSQAHLVLNFDDETVREIKDETNLQELTFGFQEGADFQATDIKLNGGTNFKINYKGNIVPFWLKNLFGKEQIYAALAAAAAGVVFGLNLIEISQALKTYQSLPGKMRLIKGIKNSWILDDSESATVFSMIEAIEILGKLQDFKRKIAVLGDVIGVGKYTVEAHLVIGERVVKNADLLFTFGPRAKFIAQGAREKGLTLDRIFSFDTIDQGKLKLQEEIKENDLILAAGSKEMEMANIIKEIKAIKTTDQGIG